MTKQKKNTINKPTKAEIKKYCQQQAKIAQKNTNEINLANKKFKPFVNWKLDWVLKDHPSILFNELKRIEKMLKSSSEK